MANKYNWKDNYGFDEPSMSVEYLSVLGNKNIAEGKGSRSTPRYSKGNVNVRTEVAVLSSGLHDGFCTLQASRCSFYGQGMDNTIWDKRIVSSSPHDPAYNKIFNMYNMTILNYPGVLTVPSLYQCDYRTNVFNNQVFIKCKIRVPIAINNGSSNALSFIGTDIELPRTAIQNILYDKCNILILSQSDANLANTRYAAFNDCKFKIGLGPEYIPLSGNTAEELRASFVVRCKAAGFNVPVITEYGETLQAGRWIFSKNSATDGLVITGSEIHQFEIPRLIAFGYKPERGNIISITSDKNKANSFSSQYADSNVLGVTNEGISFKPSVDISKPVNTSAKSNVIWLGEKSQVNLINIIHNLPKEYGVFIDSTPTLSDTPVATIKEGKTYYVRSSNTEEATIVYNKLTYSSALLNQANVFFGVAAETSFTNVSGNAVVYEVMDNKAIHQTIQMRIVNKIPAGKILAGTSLTSGYWYLVEHDLNQSNKTDYVTYNGVNYPVGGSFLASGAASFTKSGNVHLRRCWRDVFDYGSETVDKSFWENEQKPIWFDVRPDDLRCLMKNNNGNASEMMTDTGGRYRTSGHESFYDDILGTSGIRIPAFPIKGTYMQLRLVITTQNPM